MAMAKKCDRCGRYYDNDEYALYVKEGDIDFGGMKIKDLCPDCAECFRQWMDEYRHTDK